MAIKSIIVRRTDLYFGDIFILKKDLGLFSKMDANINEGIRNTDMACMICDVFKNAIDCDNPAIPSLDAKNVAVIDIMTIPIVNPRMVNIQRNSNCDHPPIL